MAASVTRPRTPSHSYLLSISTISSCSNVSLRRFIFPTFSLSSPLPAATRSEVRFHSDKPICAKLNFIPIKTSQIWHHRSLCHYKWPSPFPIAIADARSFHTSPSRQREHHFDTLKLVERLQREGFSEEQAVAMMNVLSDVIEESVQNLTRTMVSQAEQEKITYTQKVDFSQLRSDLQTHHSTEYQATRAEYERLSSEIAKLNSRLREEIIRAQNSIKLDLNLEKGRIREEASVHELKIKETDTRIETEVGMIRGTLETVKFSTLQWLIGVCTGTAALILGVWRLLA